MTSRKISQLYEKPILEATNRLLLNQGGNTRVGALSALIPADGLTGQQLAKISNSDYDCWFINKQGPQIAHISFETDPGNSFFNISTLYNMRINYNSITGLEFLNEDVPNLNTVMSIPAGTYRFVWIGVPDDTTNQHMGALMEYPIDQDGEVPLCQQAPGLAMPFRANSLAIVPTTGNYVLTVNDSAVYDKGSRAAIHPNYANHGMTPSTHPLAQCFLFIQKL